MKKYLLWGVIVGLLSSFAGALLIVPNQGSGSFAPMFAMIPLALGAIVTSVIPGLTDFVVLTLLSALPNNQPEKDIAIVIVNFFAWIILFIIIGYLKKRKVDQASSL